MAYINRDNLSSSIFDMIDIKNATRALHAEPKDGDGSIITVLDCIDNVLHFLEGLQEK